MNRRFLSGKKAKSAGASFENMLHRTALRQGFNVEQIPTGSRQISADRWIRVRTPFDFIIGKDGISMFIDCKSFSSKSMSHSQMTTHQVDSLIKWHQHGFIAGYLVYFSSIDRVVFYSAPLLASLEPRKSLSVEDGLELGGILSFQLNKILNRSDYGKVLSDNCG